MTVNHHVSEDLLMRLLRLYGVYNTNLIEGIGEPLFPDALQTKKEIMMRLVLSGFLSKIPEAIFLPVSRILKVSLQRTKGNLNNDEHYLEKILRENHSGNGLWSKPPRPLVLTHDIDLIACVKGIDKVARIENDLGIFSTWHFLTGGRYKPDHSLLHDLTQSGHEIGLHGVWHDLALGFRSQRYQIKMIKEGLTELSPYKPISFRAPGLAWTPLLADSLAACGIRADSSLRTYNNGWRIFRPIPINNGRLWELPLTLQDDHLFKDLRLDDKDAGLFISNTLTKAEDRSAPVVFNFHPSIIKDRLNWYKETLYGIQGSGKWDIVRVCDIVGKLDEAWEKTGGDEK
ncbi:MAG: polysaccharide deacetylase family protein [Nitrospirae bacterium]|nr:polysaccharide deacetylase family protein [Nitrospirota bacterium]